MVRRVAAVIRPEERGRALRAAITSLRQRVERRDFISKIDLFEVVVVEGGTRGVCGRGQQPFMWGVRYRELKSG